MKRRTFLAMLGSAGAASAVTLPAWSGSQTQKSGDPAGVLIDTTRCLGCQTCEAACAEANGLPEPAPNDTNNSSLRQTTTTQLTAVQTFKTDKGEVYVKRQCMHCLEPACAAACLTKAMNKTDEGPVEWRVGKCMGCRYCMLSCPFEMPRFEYNKAVPSIVKCQMCHARLAEGKRPACVENCPNEALMFGKRSELLSEAHKRIAEQPDAYYPHVYGEREAGGTSVLYLSAVPFEQIGLRTDLGEIAYPEYTRNFLTAVPVVLTLGPMALLALNRATDRGGEEQ